MVVVDAIILCVVVPIEDNGVARYPLRCMNVFRNESPAVPFAFVADSNPFELASAAVRFLRLSASFLW